MNINRIFEGLSKVLDSANQEQTQSETATLTFAPQSETTSTEKRSEQQFYGNYQHSQIESKWLAQQNNSLNQTQVVRQTLKVQAAQNSSEFKAVSPQQVKDIMRANVRPKNRPKFDSNLESYTNSLNDAMKEFGIIKPHDQAAFLATLSEESEGMTA